MALDGNVHFTGTQGVGKTTLLRALIFFYNADKDKLGLRKQNQSSFDDYYVPTPESYIIYEVSRGDDEHPFCVVLFRHHNRATFRFVDAAYDKDWFVDSLGMVASDPATVRQRIQSRGIDLSGIIDRYTQYLDVIYGYRSTKMKKDLLKYYLLRSQKYQSIRRIIQNVFLNERVDAAFIKNTIINSISDDDEEISIDLNFFRSKLVNFTDELKDLALWTAKNRHGIVEIRRDADHIIDTAHAITASEFSLRENCGMLIYALYRTESDLPVLQSKITRKEEAVKNLDVRISGLNEKYGLEHEKNLKKIGALDEKLKEVKTLRKKYAEMDIDSIVARVTSLSGLRLDLRQKEQLLTRALAQYQSISDKYKSLIDSIDNARKEYVQLRKEQSNVATSDFNQREADRLKNLAKAEDGIRMKFNSLIDETNQNLRVNQEAIHHLEMQRLKASKSSPLKQDIDKCLAAIASLRKEVADLDRKKLQNDNHLESLQNRVDRQCQELENELQLLELKLTAKADNLKTKLTEEMRTLEKFNGSFCEWLDKHVKSWEMSIGKVVDERNVLYSQTLNPKLIDTDTNTLFGIDIDFDSINKEVRTPAMIEETVRELELEINSIHAEIIKSREATELKIQEKQKDLFQSIKAIQAKNGLIPCQIEVKRQSIRKEELRVEGIRAKEAEMLKETDSRYADELEELKLKDEELQATLEKARGKRDKELKTLRKATDTERQNDHDSLDGLIRAYKAEIAARLEEDEVKIAQIKCDERAELSGAGVDTTMTDSLQKEISVAKSRIDSIERERDIVATYRNDCKRLLDHEDDFKSQKKDIEAADSALKQIFDGKYQKLKLKKSEEKIALSELKASLSRAVEAMQKTNDFIDSSACPPELKEANSIPTEQECLPIVDTIKNLTGEIYRLSDSLKSQINEFQKRFSPNNTFKFPLDFDSTAGYRRYADSLEEFVVNDKIKEYQCVTSNLYLDILSRAASDFSMLLSRESEIRRIVSDINYDFSRKTFAGVIRSITLRLDRSTMPIIQQLQNITDFWNANQYELGALNLFSGENHDDINKDAIKYLKSLTEILTRTSDLTQLPLEQTFSLKFKIEENDNTTDWTENLRAVGSEGTDILVKAIMNILLVSVFKRRAGQAGDFRLHCMMDEIGRLADENIQGILNFANERDIFIVNSSPKAHRPLSYRHLYMLSKDKDARTIVQSILSTRQANHYED